MGENFDVNKCGECGMVFQSKKELMEHMKKDHEKAQKGPEPDNAAENED